MQKHHARPASRRIMVGAAVVAFGAAAFGADESDRVEPAPMKPLTFKDEETGILFYVESDGRHVAAIDKQGKILWHRNPFEDAGLKPYRNKRPVVSRLGSPHPWMIKHMEAKGRKGPFVGLIFDSSQFGMLDEKDGEFFCLGRD